MTDLVFPSALHSRFSHSFGAAYIAYRMADILNLEEKNLKYAIVSSLLHDIGHGPFSHAFEKILVQDKDNKINHEDWTNEFLERNFKKTLESKDLDLKIVEEIISGTYIEKNKQQNINNNIVADIISSQLDSDRLDYLLRDSHFCGVPMGKVDIDWIISNLTTIDTTGHPPRLGIHKKGVRAVEHFLIGRKLFYQTVCFHPKIRIFEEILKYFLIELSESTEKNISDMVSNKYLEKFLNNIKKYKDKKISKPEFIRENFEYYSNLTDIDIWVVIKNCALGNSSSIVKLAKLIYERKPHKYFSFNRNCIGAVSSITKSLAKELGTESWEVFYIETPVTIYEKEEDPILVKNEAKKILRIQEYSELLSIVGNKLESNCGLAVSKEIWETKPNIKKKLTESLKEYIDFPKD